MKYVVIYLSGQPFDLPELCKEIFNHEKDAREFIAALARPAYLIISTDDVLVSFHD